MIYMHNIECGTCGETFTLLTRAGPEWQDEPWQVRPSVRYCPSCGKPAAGAYGGSPLFAATIPPTLIGRIPITGPVGVES